MKMLQYTKYNLKYIKIQSQKLEINMYMKNIYIFFLLFFFQITEHIFLNMGLDDNVLNKI